MEAKMVREEGREAIGNQENKGSGMHVSIYSANSTKNLLNPPKSLEMGSRNEMWMIDDFPS